MAGAHVLYSNVIAIYRHRALEVCLLDPVFEFCVMPVAAPKLLCFVWRLRFILFSYLYGAWESVLEYGLPKATKDRPASHTDGHVVL